VTIGAGRCPVLLDDTLCIRAKPDNIWYWRSRTNHTGALKCALADLSSAGTCAGHVVNAFQITIIGLEDPLIVGGRSYRQERNKQEGAMHTRIQLLKRLVAVFANEEGF